MALTKEEIKWATVMALTTPPLRGQTPEPGPPKPKRYLTFHSSAGEFSLRVYDNTRHWNGALMWSTDTVFWTEWTGEHTIFSRDGYLYLRGRGNTKITGAAEDYRWVLVGDRVSCTGNIENLLDYKLVAAGDHPEMDSYCFRNMFYGCASLIIAPELPATVLSDGCYYNLFTSCTSLNAAPELPATTLKAFCYIEMFRDCTSLTDAPELPATTLSAYCYRDMFSGCTSLSIAPELPTTMLTDGCYQSMFQDCTNLRVSDVSSTAYKYPYRIPSSGTGTTARNSLLDMFAGTGGPFTGTPTINTTYYTDHEPI